MTTKHEKKRASSKSFRQARPQIRKRKKESISSKPPPSREPNEYRGVVLPPIDIDARLRMIMLCMNRIVGEPGISRQIASHYKSKSLLGWTVEERVTQIRCRYMINQPSLDFDASIENLQEAVLHVNEVVGYMKHYPDDLYFMDTVIWFMGQLCRFKALCPLIATEALATTMALAKWHKGQEALIHDRMFSLLGQLLQVRDGTGAVQGLLTCWKNQMVDQFLDTGLQSVLMEAPFQSISTRELVLLLHINLVHRPSSKHHGHAYDFMAMLSPGVILNRNIEEITVKDLQDSMNSWENWMIERYA
jgi:hypothetical protein